MRSARTLQNPRPCAARRRHQALEPAVCGGPLRVFSALTGAPFLRLRRRRCQAMSVSSPDIRTPCLRRTSAAPQPPSDYRTYGSARSQSVSLLASPKPVPSGGPFAQDPRFSAGVQEVRSTQLSPERWAEPPSNFTRSAAPPAELATFRLGPQCQDMTTSVWARWGLSVGASRPVHAAMNPAGAGRATQTLPAPTGPRRNVRTAP